MLSHDEFSLMKEDAVVCNVGRGSVIDTYALLEALDNKSIGGALLDVFEEEPSFYKRILCNLSRRKIYVSMYRETYKKYAEHLKKYNKLYKKIKNPPDFFKILKKNKNFFI